MHGINIVFFNFLLIIKLDMSYVNQIKLIYFN